MLTIWVCNFWQKDFGAKAAHKMLVKLTPGKQNSAYSVVKLSVIMPSAVYAGCVMFLYCYAECSGASEAILLRYLEFV